MKENVIMVLEDEGLIALHLIEVLENAGYRVTGPLHSGELALKTLESSPPPDLIMMDIGLAGKLDGIETAALIRARYSIPLIFLTAYTTERNVERMREVNPAGYVVKPFIIEDLLAVVEKCLEAKNPPIRRS